MSQEPQSFKSRLKESIKHNPIYTKAIRPLRAKINALIESTLDDEAYFVRRHKKIFGYTPDFRNPKTFNEKIIHRILFDRSPVYTALADKLKARIYIAAKLYPLYENAIRGGAECNASLDSSLDSITTESIAAIQALAKTNLLEPSSPLFAPIDTLESTLLATNICPYLPKLYGIYTSFDEIDFATLPEAFAIKTNHDCGGVVLVPDKQEFLSDEARFEAARSKIQQHLATNFYTLFREWHYKDIEPRVFIEELLGADSRESSTPSTADSSTQTLENNDFHNKIAQNSSLDSSSAKVDSRDLADSTQAQPLDSSQKSASAQNLEFTLPYKAPDDYKINQCFTQTLFIEKDSDRFTNHTRIMLDSNFEPLPFQFSAENLPITTIPPIKPPTFAMMLHIAQSLAAPIHYVRVDLYECNNAIYVGELTFTPAGGTSLFNPQKWDKFYGEQWI